MVEHLTQDIHDRFVTMAEAHKAVRTLLRYIAEDPDRAGLDRTPARVVESLVEMTIGNSLDAGEVLSVQFDQGETWYGGIVAVRRIPFASLCEHHVLPFVGTADVAYIPSDQGRIVGLSKLARLVDVYARRLQVQERLTVQIVEALEEHLQPRASACIIRADHTCMTIRGVAKTSGGMVTSELRGAFKDNTSTRAELLHLLA